MPRALRFTALTVLLAAGLWWVFGNSETPPTTLPLSAGEREGYRLVTARSTPPDAAVLSNDFVPAKQALRDRVLQELAEFRARWKVAGPRVALNVYAASGDAVALVNQLEGWLEQRDLLSASAGKGGDSMGADALPAPPVAGLVIRARGADMGVARDFTLALAPILGGEVNILVDERVPAGRLLVDIVGAPRFDAEGVAHFDAH